MTQRYYNIKLYLKIVQYLLKDVIVPKKYKRCITKSYNKIRY
jgi:hypothetical protein